jgi:hypothetical protein
LAGELSGSERIGPTGQNLRKEALGQAAGIGEAATGDALARMKAAMAMRAKQMDIQGRMSEGDLNRQNRLDVQGLRGKQATALARTKAALKGGPGGPIAGKLDVFQGTLDTMEALSSKADQARGMIGPMSAGLMSASKVIPGTPARALEEFLEPIRSNEAMEKLQQLRADAQAMGQKGSGLGQVTERELSLLMNARENLSTAQPGPQLDAALKALSTQYRSSMRKIQFEIDKLRAGGNSNDEELGDGGGPTDINLILGEAGIDPLDFEDEGGY